jgi:hypothetical protein
VKVSLCFSIESSNNNFPKYDEIRWGQNFHFSMPHLRVPHYVFKTGCNRMQQNTLKGWMRQLPIAKFAPNISIRNGSSNGMFGKFILANIDTNIMERNFHANRGWLDTWNKKEKWKKDISEDQAPHRTSTTGLSQPGRSDWGEIRIISSLKFVWSVLLCITCELHLKKI